MFSFNIHLETFERWHWIRMENLKQASMNILCIALQIIHMLVYLSAFHHMIYFLREMMKYYYSYVSTSVSLLKNQARWKTSISRTLSTFHLKNGDSFLSIQSESCPAFFNNHYIIPHITQSVDATQKKFFFFKETNHQASFSRHRKNCSAVQGECVTIGQGQVQVGRSKIWRIRGMR